MTLPDKMVIGLTGKARAGKTSVADYLHTHHEFVIISLAEPLKEMLAKALRNNPPPQSLMDLYYPHYVDADEQLDQIVESLWKDRTEFSRWLLQFVGTDIIRDQVTPEWWVDDLIHRIDRQLHAKGVSHCIVVPDVRFLNEAQAIRDIVGKIWHVEREEGADEIEFGGDHTSEQEMAKITPNWCIKSAESLDNLYSVVNAVLNGEGR